MVLRWPDCGRLYMHRYYTYYAYGYICIYRLICPCVCPSGQACFRNRTLLCVWESCDATWQRVTNVVTKFPQFVWWPSQTCGDNGGRLFRQSSSPFPSHVAVIVLVHVYCHCSYFFVSQQHLAIHKGKDLLDQQDYFFYVCLIPPFSAFCMESFKDFNWKSQQFACITDINSSRGPLVSQKCCRAFDQLIAVYTTDHPPNNVSYFQHALSCITLPWNLNNSFFI